MEEFEPQELVRNNSAENLRELVLNRNFIRSAVREKNRLRRRSMSSNDLTADPNSQLTPLSRVDSNPELNAPSRKTGRSRIRDLFSPSERESIHRIPPLPRVNSFEDLNNGFIIPDTQRLRRMSRSTNDLQTIVNAPMPISLVSSNAELNSNSIPSFNEKGIWIAKFCKQYCPTLTSKCHSLDTTTFRTLLEEILQNSDEHKKELRHLKSTQLSSNYLVKFRKIIEMTVKTLGDTQFIMFNGKARKLNSSDLSGVLTPYNTDLFGKILEKTVKKLYPSLLTQDIKLPEPKKKKVRFNLKN